MSGSNRNPVASAVSRFLRRGPNISSQAGRSDYADFTTIQIARGKKCWGHGESSACSGALADISARPTWDCPSCNLLYAGIRELVDPTFAERCGKIFVFDTHIPVAGSREFIKGEQQIKLWPKDSRDPIVALEFFTQEGQASSQFTGIGSARLVSKHALSPQCIALAAKWLDECEQNHVHCKPYKASHLPTRVLNVGSRSKDPHVLETRGIKGKYVALSYCWGESLPLITTTANLREMERGIPLQSLPKTLLDSVLVARAFGVEYLWVDALCILQDSHADWIKEAAKMGDIFADAFFVIRAEAGTDCQSGFLHERNTAAGTAKVIGLQGWREFRPKVFMRSRGTRVLDAVAHSTIQSPSKLSQRAWAFQERYLARRMLVFAKEELAWECHTKMLCECRLGHQESMNTENLTDWTSLVSRYSGLQLTKIEDRLPAFSGIAASFQKSNPEVGQYVAGLWRSMVAQQLLWYAKPYNYDSPLDSRRHAVYSAPSWSWASITGPVTYHHLAESGERSIDFIIHSVKWELATDNPYGPVRSAHLDITGRMCSVSLSKNGTTNKLNLSILLGRQLRGFIPDIMEPDSDLSLSETYSFLIVVLTDTLFAGLVLRLSRSHPKAYERVGFCCDNTVYENGEHRDSLPDDERVGHLSSFLRGITMKHRVTLV